MANWDKPELLRMIEGIAPGGGTAEHESNDDKFFLNFLPIPSYKRVLEPDTLLVLGGRGAGKTELFRLLAREEGRQILMNHTGVRSLPGLANTNWIPAFGRTNRQGKEFPAPEVVAKTMAMASGPAWREFWIGMVLGVVLQRQPVNDIGWASEIPIDLRKGLGEQLSMPSKWFPEISKSLEGANYALDKLDEKLRSEDKWLFITYDELDRLLPEHAALAVPIRELLAFWLDRWRRWERIRPKIFLRTDLFQEEFLGFPDASKLQGHQVRLEWAAIELYQLLIKRLANAGDLMTDYVREVVGLLPDKRTELIGWLPTNQEGIVQDFIEKMIGKFMGANPRKGYTFSWIPNHLQDAGGRIAPRSFLKLFSLAASKQLDRQTTSGTGDQLLQPTDLQASLMQTSQDRIKELQEEYPWLEALKSGLADKEVPMELSAFQRALTEPNWSKSSPPPAADPASILSLLLQLGIVELRSDRRVNMPEIYLYGFALKRRGGIKRPK